MAKIISVMNEKGGAGKSTLAICLACGYHRQGKNTLLVDCDPQGTARDWRNMLGEGADLPSVIPLDRSEVFKTSIKTLSADIIIIDTPARAEKMSAAVIANSDVVLIPVQPSGADIWAAETIVRMVEQRIELGGQLLAGFVLNRIMPNRKLAQEAQSGEWNEYSIPILDTKIADRETYKRAITEGKSIYEFAGEARAEIDCLIQEIEQSE
jgi:chromosome partitioning protein